MVRAVVALPEKEVKRVVSNWLVVGLIVKPLLFCKLELMFKEGIKFPKASRRAISANSTSSCDCLMEILFSNACATHSCNVHFFVWEFAARERKITQASKIDFLIIRVVNICLSNRKDVTNKFNFYRAFIAWAGLIWFHTFTLSLLFRPLRTSTNIPSLTPNCTSCLLNCWSPV